MCPLGFKKWGHLPLSGRLAAPQPHGKGVAAHRTSQASETPRALILAREPRGSVFPSVKWVQQHLRQGGRWAFSESGEVTAHRYVFSPSSPISFFLMWLTMVVPHCPGEAG